MANKQDEMVFVRNASQSDADSEALDKAGFDSAAVLGLITGAVSAVAMLAETQLPEIASKILQVVKKKWLAALLIGGFAFYAAGDRKEGQA